jgi:hypothetical protein
MRMRVLGPNAARGRVDSAGWLEVPESNFLKLRVVARNYVRYRTES